MNILKKILPKKKEKPYHGPLVKVYIDRFGLRTKYADEIKKLPSPAKKQLKSFFEEVIASMEKEEND